MPLPGPRHLIEATVMHCWDPPHHDKVYVIWIENRGGPNPFFVCGGYGARAIRGMLKVDPKGEFSTLSAARSKVQQVVQEKHRKKGYADVETNAYTARMVTFDQFVNPSKIDTSRIIGYSVGAEVVAAPTSAPITPQKQRKVQVGSARVSRAVDL